MVAPSTQVIAFFDLSATGGDFFTLDDPVLGELDDAAAILAGDIATDITDDVTRVSVRRGRESQLFADMPAGRWQIQLNNEDRDYDPLYGSSPYDGNIIPGKRVQVVANGVVIADGNIEDWNLDYEPGGRSVAIVDCADALSSLAAMQFNAWTTTAGQIAGERITAVLGRGEVNWTQNRAIGAGISTLQGDVVDWGTNVLAYLNLVAKSDYGWLYASRDGVLKFRDRHYALNEGLPPLCFSDDGSGLPYSSIAVSYGTEKLYNRVGIDREGGVEQTAANADSQQKYRVRSFSQTGLLLDSDAQSLSMANYLVGIYAEPELRISSLTVQLAALTEPEQRQVLELDLVSLVCVTFTPNGVGTAIERTCIVEGISHDITPASHVVTLSLGDVDRRSFLRLDDSVFGRLDLNVLAF